MLQQVYLDTDSQFNMGQYQATVSKIGCSSGLQASSNTRLDPIKFQMPHQQEN